MQCSIVTDVASGRVPAPEIRSRSLQCEVCRIGNAMASLLLKLGTLSCTAVLQRVATVSQCLCKRPDSMPRSCTMWYS